MKRISQANKAYNKWADDYKVVRCKRYWKGHQRLKESRIDAKGQERAIVNLVRPAVRATIPSLYFYHPFARINASPAVTDTQGQNLDERAMLLQDTANSIVKDPDTAFREETLDSLKDAFWSYGVIEIGHSAQFVDNPAYNRPSLVEDEKTKEEIGEPETTKDEAAPPGAPPTPETPEQNIQSSIASLAQFVESERFYVRRIPPETARCSVNGKPSVLQNDWFGYFEWMYVEDVKTSNAYRRTSKLKASGDLAEGYSDTKSQTDGAVPSDPAEDDDSEDRRERGGMVKVWKIWSLRDKKRYVLAQGHETFLLEETYTVFPLFFLRFETDPDEFYPIPPIFSQIFQQDEYNDSREMLRGLRKTVYNRYLVKKDAIEEDQMVKLEEGGPNVYAEVDQELSGVIAPVPQTFMDSAVIRTLAVSKDDFAQVSMVGGEAKGQAESGTATQAGIIDDRAKAREGFDRTLVALWLGAIIRGLITLAKERMSLPMWILRNTDPFSPYAAQDAQAISERYRQITLDDLTSADKLLRWDVSVDVESLSPITEATARQDMVQLITMASNPATATLLSRSPSLLKRALDAFGIKNANDQDAIREALGIVGPAMLAQGVNSPNIPGAPAPGPSYSAAPGGPGPATPEQPPQQPQPGPAGAAPPQA